jgi:hypothetical protein
MLSFELSLKSPIIFILFVFFKFVAELSSLLSSSSSSRSCYQFPHTYISFVVVECTEAAAAAVVVPVPVDVFGLFLMVIQTVKCIFLQEIYVWVWCSFLIFSRIFCRICCITAVVVLIVLVDAVSLGAQV